MKPHSDISTNPNLEAPPDLRLPATEGPRGPPDSGYLKLVQLVHSVVCFYLQLSGGEEQLSRDEEATKINICCNKSLK